MTVEVLTDVDLRLLEVLKIKLGGTLTLDKYHKLKSSIVKKGRERDHVFIIQCENDMEIIRIPVDEEESIF